MTSWQALILGSIQGITEFIPVSSSGHLALAHYLFRWGEGTANDFLFDIATNVGTLLAVCIYFRKDWIALLTEKTHRKMLGLILLASIPGAIAGKLLKHEAETAFRAPTHIAALLAVMGLVLLTADLCSRRNRDITRINLLDSLLIGCSQALAIMPGVSRSGVTIAAGLFLGLDRESAARFSFLLSVPIIAGAVLFGCKDLAHGFPAGQAGDFCIAIIASAITGYLAIGFLLKFLQRRGFTPFVVYRIVLAAVVFAVVLTRS